VFRSRSRPSRPLLLLIVLGVLLAVVGVTATAQAVMVSAYASTSTLEAFVQGDIATIRGVAQDRLTPDLADPAAPPGASSAVASAVLAALVSKGQLLQIELRRPDGAIVAASDTSVVGSTVAPSADFGAAVGSGSVQVAIVPEAAAEAAGSGLASATVLREYLPISAGGRVILVAALWRDAVPLLGGLDQLRTDVVLVTLTAALIAAGVLVLVFRSAQGRLSRQAQALVESSRRDALTGLLNHGSLVGLLAEQVERARDEGAGFELALVDVDNFRLLNDAHGHRLGDRALLAVTAALRGQLAADDLVGRYGPDEFLVVGPVGRLGEVLRAIEALRSTLAATTLDLESGEQLPMTISAGVCAFPEHGASATSLLSVASRTLEEARAGGGDAIRVATAEESSGASAASSFDVLKGLVLAIDTKDRYTKRHSEDVSRYAAFIAEQLGLDAELIRTIRVAGLLHDVGKIGIPDEILRKPGRLTADETTVIQQHVALGDMIVRELPDLETVRAAIRHHHERWDGKGYLAGLAGADIPVVARILAVADAFSAMTTSRPYRKALPVAEAMRRLGDAAGSQLDESLVATFLRGIETAAEPPLPGIEVAPATLWTPLRRAA
jgi:diguanylate cyclase (GGDEF)-like protein/putative nucleotidyltransferase with HDIG domain